MEERLATDDCAPHPHRPVVPINSNQTGREDGPLLSTLRYETPISRAGERVLVDTPPHVPNPFSPPFALFFLFFPLASFSLPTPMSFVKDLQAALDDDEAVAEWLATQARHARRRLAALGLEMEYDAEEEDEDAEDDDDGSMCVVLRG